MFPKSGVQGRASCFRRYNVHLDQEDTTSRLFTSSKQLYNFVNNMIYLQFSTLPQGYDFTTNPGRRTKVHRWKKNESPSMLLITPDKPHPRLSLLRIHSVHLLFVRYNENDFPCTKGVRSHGDSRLHCKQRLKMF